MDPSPRMSAAAPDLASRPNRSQISRGTASADAPISATGQSPAIAGMTTTMASDAGVISRNRRSLKLEALFACYFSGRPERNGGVSGRSWVCGGRFQSCVAERIQPSGSAIQAIDFEAEPAVVGEDVDAVPSPDHVGIRWQFARVGDGQLVGRFRGGDCVVADVDERNPVE